MTETHKPEYSQRAECLHTFIHVLGVRCTGADLKSYTSAPVTAVCKIGRVPVSESNIAASRSILLRDDLFISTALFQICESLWDNSEKLHKMFIHVRPG